MTNQLLKYLLITAISATIQWSDFCSAQQYPQANAGGFGTTWGTGVPPSYPLQRPEFVEPLPSVKNATTAPGVTYYWGSHQVGESVLAFGKDKFSWPVPVPVYRTLSHSNPESKISYLEVFVRNAAPEDHVYVSSGAIGTGFIGVYIGSKTPTTYFEYKATLYGFE